MSVTDRTTPEGDRFMKELRELTGLEVFVGFQRGEKHSDAEADTIDIAAWNELGTSNGIPSRPFLRQAFDNNAADIDATLSAAAKMIQSGASAQQAASVVGAKMKALVQKEIVDGGFRSNADSTKKRKKSDVPLIDTGHMRQSVSFVIRKKGSGEE